MGANMILWRAAIEGSVKNLLPALEKEGASVAKKVVARALKVVSNDSSIPNEDLTDGFDWLGYEDGGGSAKVTGSEGYSAEPLQSWVPRNDSLQHGHFMLYQMNNAFSNLSDAMEEFFFSVSMDVGVNPQYQADGVAAI